MVTGQETERAANGIVPADYHAAHDLEAVEIKLLLEAILEVHGFDFREYAHASLKRRIHLFMRNEELRTVSGLQERVLHVPGTMERLAVALSVNVTSLFRDPEFFGLFRREIIPWLRTYPFIRIWHAGCSTGEEVYSMAILLHEAGLYERSRIYATDIEDGILRRAKEGIFSLSQEKEYSENYLRAGGGENLQRYYTSAYGSAVFRGFLKENIVFSRHNLAKDASFNEFQVILCRNVMIYFRKPLQNRVHELLFNSLGLFGVLGLGAKETVHLTPHEGDYQQLTPGIKLYRRIK